MNNNIIGDQTIQQADLNYIPGFYSSLISSSPSTDRLLSINANTNISSVQEIVQANMVGSGNLVFNYQNSYQGIPVINGIISVNDQHFLILPFYSVTPVSVPITKPYISRYLTKKGFFQASVVTTNSTDVVKGILRVYNCYIDNNAYNQ